MATAIKVVSTFEATIYWAAMFCIIVKLDLTVKLDKMICDTV